MPEKVNLSLDITLPASAEKTRRLLAFLSDLHQNPELLSLVDDPLHILAHGPCSLWEPETCAHPDCVTTVMPIDGNCCGEDDPGYYRTCGYYFCGEHLWSEEDIPCWVCAACKERLKPQGITAPTETCDAR